MMAIVTSQLGQRLNAVNDQDEARDRGGGHDLSRITAVQGPGRRRPVRE